jgi:hypothetical protein
MHGYMRWVYVNVNFANEQFEMDSVETESRNGKRTRAASAFLANATALYSEIPQCVRHMLEMDTGW